jgi:hypothetical protein
MQKREWGADMKKERKVYIVMGYAVDTRVTYISEICSSKKKAESHQKYMTELMDKTEHPRTYWVYDGRVA